MNGWLNLISPTVFGAKAKAKFQPYENLVASLQAHSQGQAIAYVILESD